ncbi:MAG: site-2 protease family protein, partial [Halioglobus sp.]|nr:site-2 protease family protein [Halioglobus sp.]
MLIYLIGISYWNQQGTLAAVVAGVGFILALFACVVLHELGHSLTARRYGIETRNITLLPIGGVASLEKMPENPRQEIHVALAGPAVNFVIAFILYLYLGMRGDELAGEAATMTDASFVYRLMLLNVLLGGFNLLPAFPMDGGRVFRALLAMKTGREKATRIAATVGQGVAF